jgi:hypothetical protein
LFVYVSDFYAKNPQAKTEIGLLSENASPRPAPPKLRDDERHESFDSYVGAAVWGMPNLKEDFQDYVWDLLRGEDDFSVGKDNEGCNMSLKDIVDDLRKDKAADREVVLAGSGVKDQKGHEKWRVFASEERRWRALTGHGVDPKKVTCRDLPLIRLVKVSSD